MKRAGKNETLERIDMFREFVEDAKYHGRTLRNRNATLDQEIQELTDRLEEARAKQENLPVQIERAENYGMLGNQLTCPRCYVENGQENDVVPQPSDDNSDKFRCRKCGYEGSINIA